MPRAEHMSSENWGGDRGNTSGGSSGGMSVDVILDNLARGDTGPEYAAQWASYYRSQGMTNEAVMIDTFVRGLVAGRQAKEERSALPPPRDSMANPASETCYRCNKPGHFARDCPDLDRSNPNDLDRRPRKFPCKDGAACKFLSLPLGCRYEHDERSIARNAALGSAIECYRCNGFGHFARDCPTSAGLNRAALPRGGGPIRGKVVHSSRDQPTTTLECYLCNRVGHFARNCARGTEERSQRCLKCHRRGHFAKDCREEESRCFKCYKNGHLAKDCDEPDLCYHCNKRGHISRDCPDSGMKTCFKCGGKGHIALECPSPKGATTDTRSKKEEKKNKEDDDEDVGPEDL